MPIAISTLPPHDRRDENEETARTMVSGRESMRMRRDLATKMLPVLSAIAGEKMDLHAAGKLVVEFEDAYATRPISQNSGGSGFNDSLWLFTLARLMDPARIVESGTHRGHSAWLLRQACPAAEIASFDISHKMLDHREPDIGYLECDWMDMEIDAGSGMALAFFDDHVSHAHRIAEAHARGFRYLLMDDNLPATVLYATGSAPVPTVEMIEDETLRHGQEIAWTRNGKRYAWKVNGPEINAARDLIDVVIVLPELCTVNRYRPGNRLTLVRLVD